MICKTKGIIIIYHFSLITIVKIIIIIEHKYVWQRYKSMYETKHEN